MANISGKVKSMPMWLILQPAIRSMHSMGMDQSPLSRTISFQMGLLMEIRGLTLTITVTTGLLILPLETPNFLLPAPTNKVQTGCRKYSIPPLSKTINWAYREVPKQGGMHFQQITSINRAFSCIMDTNGIPLGQTPNLPSRTGSESERIYR